LVQKTIYTLLLLSIFIACKKNETTAPVVAIYAPVENDSFYMADSFNINFNIKDAHLQSYKVIISNKLTGRIYINEEGETNSTDFTYNQKKHIEVLADTSVFMSVLGIDASGNTGGKNVTFKIKL